VKLQNRTPPILADVPLVLLHLLSGINYCSLSGSPTYWVPSNTVLRLI